MASLNDVLRLGHVILTNAFRVRHCYCFGTAIESQLWQAVERSEEKLLSCLEPGHCSKDATPVIKHRPFQDSYQSRCPQADWSHPAMQTHAAVSTPWHPHPAVHMCGLRQQGPDPGNSWRCSPLPRLQKPRRPNLQKTSKCRRNL